MRSRLAWQRTELANERTLLSCIRTALGCFAVGIPAVWWLEGVVIQTLGVVSLIMGAVFLGGVRRFLTIKAGIDRQPAWKGNLSEKQSRDVLASVRTLAK